MIQTNVFLVSENINGLSTTSKCIEEKLGNIYDYFIFLYAGDTALIII